MATLYTTSTKALSTPAPTTAGAETPLTSHKPYSRMASVSLQEANQRAFPRVFNIQVPKDGRLWPCLYFPTYDAMLTEMEAYHKTGGPVVVDDGEMTEICMTWMDESNELEEDEDADTIPLVLLLGLNKIIVKPREKDMTHIAHGIVQLTKASKVDPVLKQALKKMHLVVQHFSSRRGVKRGAEVLVRPLNASMGAAGGQANVEMTPVAVAAAKPAATLEAPVATAAAATASESPAAAEKKMAATEEVVPHVSPGGDSTASHPATATSNKRPKLSRAPVNEAEYISKEGNLKLDEVEANWTAKPEASKKKRAPNAASKKKKESLVQEVHEATPVRHPQARPQALSTSDALPQDAAALDLDLGLESSKNTVQDATMTEADINAKDPVAATRKPRNASKKEDEPEPVATVRKTRIASKKEDEPEPVATARKTRTVSKTSTKTPAQQKKRGAKTPAREITKMSKKNKNSVATKKMEKAPKALPTLATTLLNSKDSVILSEEEQEIPTWYDVRHILEAAGFTVRAFTSLTDAEFCFPGGDPRVNKDAILGKDYFKSLESFQARLCSHGFGEDSAISTIVDLNTAGGAKFERWVRLGAFQPQIARLVTNKLPLPDVRAKTVAYKDLQNIGFGWKNSMPYYQHGEPGGPWTEDGIPISFVEQSDFYTHLSRYGFPEECDVGALDNEEISRLVLPLVFHKRGLADPSPSQGRGSRRRRSLDVVPEVVKSAKKSKAKEAVKSVKKAKQPRNAAKKEKASVLATPMEITEPLPSSPSRCDKHALEDCHRNPPGKVGRVMRGLGRDITAEIEDASNDIDKLKACLDKLESTQVSDSTWLGDYGGHFRRNADEVKHLMELMVRSRRPGNTILGREEERNAMYICGTAGIGKTTAVNWAAEQLMEAISTDRVLGKGVELVVVNINCSQFASGSPNMRSVFFRRVWEECNSGAHTEKKDAEKALLRSLTSTSSANDKKKFLILVLDEIDQLVDATSEAFSPKGSGEKLLNDLGTWSMANEEMRFALVGIGNAMNNNKFRRANQFAQFRHTRSFKSYNQADMEEIMRSRLEDSSVVQPAALTFIAKKTSSSSGDVRKAIEHLTTALKDAEERAQKQTNDGVAATQGQYLVSMRDVIKVNSDYAKLSKIIDDQPTATKLAVSVAAKMVKENNEGDIHRRDLVEALCDAWFKKNNEYLHDAFDHVGTLGDMGICKFIHRDLNPDNDVIHFDFLSQELQEAADVALKNEFYDV